MLSVHFTKLIVNLCIMSSLLRRFFPFHCPFDHPKLIREQCKPRESIEFRNSRPVAVKSGTLVFNPPTRLKEINQEDKLGNSAQRSLKAVRDLSLLICDSMLRSHPARLEKELLVSRCDHQLEICSTTMITSFGRTALSNAASLRSHKHERSHDATNYKESFVPI